MPFGVDEAGKGPALGSMFAAAVSLEDPEYLPEGIADSKRLTPERREELAATLRDDDRIAVGVAEITPARIDHPETDMNSLAVDAHAGAIDDAFTDCDLDPSEDSSIGGLCDACDTDADRFARRVTEACSSETDRRLDLEARHGADEDSPIVGAASVIAKVERDAHVDAIAAEHGDVGSGYPSDPTTREFLETYVDDHGDLPPFARESWSTCADVLAAAEQTGLEQF
ncbi:ribonuclease HII [Natrarchaeobius halalkaliphilus]|uniref:Ribonuclease HII n=1 Tax=Natrarchaeobius halalkaliphilus TaxID=1679091 RepID=A0A3N6M6G7_9EURY|nr:ribonuclease HII [Natrarchaeobius halalkaliphilus]RQG91670.1 ribonuclease HII [Natrarchaeobius halalkaliphilus]